MERRGNVVEQRGDIVEQRRENILLVDDRPENLLVLESVLEDCEYNLFKAQSGYEALRMALRHPLDMVLLDVQMSGMDGFEVATLLRGKRETKDVAIIFITANSKDPEHIQRGYDIGAENYLFKPIDPEELKQKIEAALKFRRYKRQMKLHDMRTSRRQSQHHHCD